MPSEPVTAMMGQGQTSSFGTKEEVFSRSAMLKDIGLDTPQICSIVDFLKQKGYNMPEDVYTVEKAADVICNIIKGDTNA